MGSMPYGWRNETRLLAGAFAAATALYAALVLLSGGAWIGGLPSPSALPSLAPVHAAPTAHTSTGHRIARSNAHRGTSGPRASFGVVQTQRPQVPTVPATPPRQPDAPASTPTGPAGLAAPSAPTPLPTAATSFTSPSPSTVALPTATVPQPNLVLPSLPLP